MLADFKKALFPVASKWISKWIGSMKHWKVLPSTMVVRQEKNFNSRRSRMAKTIILWLWWQSFNSFCFQTFSLFCLCLHFFLFATQKHGGYGSLTHPLPVSLALTSHFTWALIWKKSLLICFKLLGYLLYSHTDRVERGW